MLCLTATYQRPPTAKVQQWQKANSIITHQIHRQHDIDPEDVPDGKCINEVSLVVSPKYVSGPVVKLTFRHGARHAVYSTHLTTKHDPSRCACIGCVAYSAYVAYTSKKWILVGLS